jgi:hypothetical protein
MQMLPLQPLWPIGTFLQITTDSSSVPLWLVQRLQRKDNSKKWTGVSAPLDVTEHVKCIDKPFQIELICADDQPFLLCLAWCTYRPVKGICDILLGPKTNPIAIHYATKEEGKRKAALQTIVLCDSDDEAAKAKEDIAHDVISFSLIDSYSKKLIKTPILGRHCAHFQVVGV